jgi:hypothetical protein
MVTWRLVARLERCAPCHREILQSNLADGQFMEGYPNGTYEGGQYV